MKKNCRRERESEKKGVSVALMQRARPNCPADCLLLIAARSGCDRAQVQPIKHTHILHL